MVKRSVPVVHVEMFPARCLMAGPVVAFISIILLVLSVLNSTDIDSASSPSFSLLNTSNVTIMPVETKPFSLFVTLVFSAEEKKESFCNEFATLAEYVMKNEPDTLAYELLLSDKDPLRVLIMERYKDKENAYLKIHRSSEAFLAFRPKLKAMEDVGDVTIHGDSYLDAGLGFGDRVAE